MKKKNIIFILGLFLIPLFMVICGEFIQRGSLIDVAKWMLHNRPAFLLNYVISLSFILLIGAFFRNVYIGLSLYFFIMFFLELLNKYKMKFLEDPIFPWDLMLYNQVINLFPQLYKALNPLLILPLILVPVLVVFLIKKMPSFKISYTFRIISGVLALLLLVGISFYRSTPMQKVFTKFNIVNKTWNQNENYQFNGLLLSFLMNVQSAVVLAPSEYSEEKMNSIISSIQQKYPAVATVSNTDQKVKPNVIFVMNEAFWDPTLLKNVSYSQDPMSTVRALQLAGNGGWVISPEYGGGTANVEFEALTGFSMNFVPSGSVPYQQYITRPTPSLASIFAKEGYETIAIHPNDKWFWNRDVVYENLGFDKFISIEQFNNPSKAKRGTYVDDVEVTKSIIEQTEKSDEPVFIYAVTIQNHGTYYYPKERPEYPIDVKGNFSDEVKEQLHVYSNGVLDGDTELKKLIDYYKNADEPTIIVFFGDHLPYLGTAYDETGYYSSTSGLERNKSMSRTPLVIWNNFGKKVDLPQDTISTSFLGTYIFDLAGVNTPLYYKFLEDFRSKLPGYKTILKMDSKGELYLDTPPEYKELEKEYELLQYDLLFGKQYVKDKLF